MTFFKHRKTIDRLHQMIDNAIDGNPIEQGFDESRLSALETKLSDFLSMNRATKQQLAEEKTNINELISDISHQSKTPLANILLYSQLLSESTLSEQDKTCVRSLQQQAEKLNFLISSLVKTSRLETGIIAVTPKQDQVSRVIDAVVEQAAPKAKAKGISFTATPCEIEAFFDLKWTIEALYNLVDNALKYTPTGGSVQVSVTAYQLFCRIDVSDTGIGILPEETAKIFSRFYRSETVADQEGVGLGLYLTREIIAAQGGYVKVTSRPEQGSIFSLFLPMKT